CIVLCDTNGGSFPDEIYSITEIVRKEINTSIGIHCHNDAGFAVANSIMCVKAGADHVQGTFLGIGERSGNANLATIIPNLQVKLDYQCIPEEKIGELTSTAKYIAQVSNI